MECQVITFKQEMVCSFIYCLFLERSCFRKVMTQKTLSLPLYSWAGRGTVVEYGLSFMGSHYATTQAIPGNQSTHGSSDVSAALIHS